MKKVITILTILLCTLPLQAQSLKDLLNQENIEKAVNAVTGKNTITDMTGTWSYTGSAIQLQSDNALSKLGGTAASGIAESKLNEQLKKVGISEGKMSFTFHADSTFQSKVGKKDLKGTYSYNAESKQVNLKFSKLLNINAQVNMTSNQMDLLFKADRLLKLLNYISSKSNNSTLKAISSLSENYDGMMMGFSMTKQEVITVSQ
ncbi:MAG: DUF4923 family protein [Mediterranea massiliensis]|nr:DUF4923 family protein [Mediterranea massiliensis]